eukprot:CAMPEP_0119398446 /NCGR_PEP_ID=MMETSP1334-20130426/140835_1 /TAXON_ID=127549 /ORGANISM="Calcidiscus leptoporus, Strain RCC1130" /LENGTH=101 /DNA_ID=CAMNT_0007422307 /DNA_START=118 /DNA_END=423 /DNA_ORIENTATION=+
MAGTWPGAPGVPAASRSRPGHAPWGFVTRQGPTDRPRAAVLSLSTRRVGRQGRQRHVCLGHLPAGSWPGPGRVLAASWHLGWPRVRKTGAREAVFAKLEFF